MERHVAPCECTHGTGVPGLVAHVVGVHHAYLRRELPHVAAMVSAVREAHAARYPELATVAATFVALWADIEPNLVREERVLFPMCEALVAGDERSGVQPASLLHPVQLVLEDHDKARGLLDQLEELTGGFVAPVGVDPDVVGMVAALADVAVDLRRCLAEEDDLLFPQILRLAHAPG